jgi:lysozyme
VITSIQQQLLRDEDEVLHVYKDSLGYWTIGVGHMVDERKGGAIPKQISDMLLNYDIAEVTTQLTGRVPFFTRLDDVRRGVLVNMAFQLGIAGLLGFSHTLSLIEAGQYGPASKAMLQSLWAKQTPDRAARLSKQMETGVWQ